MKKAYMFFVVICLLLMLMPFGGMAVVKSNSASESGEEIEIPSVQKEDGSINIHYLGELGDYFSDNFAGRQEMVSINAWIYGNIFHVSTTDQVLLGTQDWMYYTNTLNDYTATHLMTERGLNNIVHNLSLMQNFVEENGSEFIFTIAPNKNSLYDENMPYYYNKGENNNYERLVPKLELEGIHYVNLYEEFENQDEVLYLKQDSHWNNKGAVLVYNRIMQETDLDYETYDDVTYEIRKEHVGDLAEMIYPLNYKLEENQYYNKDWQFEYYGEVDSNMDNFITTTSPKSNQVLFMYRDSFGESLLPFFAEEFGVAYFSRLVPYNLNDILTYQPDYVVMERVERRLSSFAEQGAVMEVPIVSASMKNGNVVFNKQWSDILSHESLKDHGTEVSIKQNGGYYQIDGTVNKKLMTDETSIYITMVTGNEEITYETFWISKQEGKSVNDYGFSAYFPCDEIPENITQLQISINR